VGTSLSRKNAGLKAYQITHPSFIGMQPNFLLIARHTLERMTEMVLWLSEDGKVVYCNPVFFQHFAYEESELYGQDVSRLLTRMTKSEMASLHRRLRNTGKETVITKIVAKNKSTRDYTLDFHFAIFEGQKGYSYAFIRASKSETPPLLSEKSNTIGTSQTLLEPNRNSLIVGKSLALTELLDKARRVANGNAPVLIEGEPGTGKELIARYVYANSIRAEKPFTAVNCSTLDGDTIASELFGHVKGAYTGALRDRNGLLQSSDGGTLFLDEIAELSLRVQAMLLRAIEYGTFKPLGSDKEVKVDVRIITATNRDLALMVKAGTFRHDLYTRLLAFHLKVPPLRSRREDIPGLITHFLTRLNETSGLSIGEPLLANVKKFQSDSFHGNVRELSHRVENCYYLHSNDRLILIADDSSVDIPAALENYQTLEEVHRDYLRRVLLYTNGKISGPGGAAELIKINHHTLASKVKKLGL
jgi:transcriptional regulator with GAF, ATPase, and Fis domain